MEFWLIQDSKKLQLPIPPSNYKITKEMNNSSEMIENFGEVNFLGKPKLKTTTISSFFPLRIYSFCQYSEFPQPLDCVKLIEGWQDSMKPIRLLITETSINILCSIESFIYGEDDGTGDINFELSLKEYKVLP